MSDDQREDIARILETVARDGLPGPRDLDAALDAIDARYAARLEALETVAAQNKGALRLEIAAHERRIAHIERLTSLYESLRREALAALEPFAKEAERRAEYFGVEDPTLAVHREAYHIMVGDLRRAAALREKLKGEGE